MMSKRVLICLCGLTVLLLIVVVCIATASFEVAPNESTVAGDGLELTVVRIASALESNTSIEIQIKRTVTGGAGMHIFYRAHNPISVVLFDSNGEQTEETRTAIDVSESLAFGRTKAERFRVPCRLRQDTKAVSVVFAGLRTIPTKVE